MTMNYQEAFAHWKQCADKDEALAAELAALSDEKDIEDRFYQPMAFGTAGMRGKIGCGTNRMNEYVVAKATEGLARYLLKADPANGEKGVAIAFDSRIKSDIFARIAARVLAAKGIKAYLFDSLRPVPVLSFTVRHLETAAGIEITASHNTKEYNGYKVYGPDGGQITEKAAEAISYEMAQVPDYFGIPMAEPDDPRIIAVPSSVDDAFAAAVESVVRARPDSDLKVIYTPLHGSGNLPVRRVLRDLGYSNVRVVPEQEWPDGTFPTVEKPNPEEKAVFESAIAMARKAVADVIIGTDPDCDRMGVVCQSTAGDYIVLTGNQTGALLADYLLKTRDYGKDKAIIKTIVTSELGRAVAEAYGADCVDVLTGFKYIGEKMTQWKTAGTPAFVMGYEESYGYLSGDHARDKDGVVAAALVCEMADDYKAKGMTLYEALEALYQKHGYYIEDQQAIALGGVEGPAQIRKIMDAFREDWFDTLTDEKLIRVNDYLSSTSRLQSEGTIEPIDLPVSNVIKFVFDQHSWYALRPSGTEPKLKIYYSVRGKTREEAEEKMRVLKQLVNDRLPES